MMRVRESPIQKKTRILGIIHKSINTVFMYNFRGELINQFAKQSEAATFLGKSEAAISKYVKNENRFDGCHFLCRRKV